MLTLIDLSMLRQVALGRSSVTEPTTVGERILTGNPFLSCLSASLRNDSLFLKIVFSDARIINTSSLHSSVILSPSS